VTYEIRDDRAAPAPGFHYAPFGFAFIHPHDLLFEFRANVWTFFY
jgi:hypothetical protein